MLASQQRRQTTRKSKIKKVKKNKQTGEDSCVARDVSARQVVPRGGGGEGSSFHPPLPLPSLLPLHQLVARAGRLVILYCELRGPVHRHGPEQATAAQLEEIHQVPEAAVAAERWRERGREQGRGRIM